MNMCFLYTRHIVKYVYYACSNQLCTCLTCPKHLFLDSLKKVCPTLWSTDITLSISQSKLTIPRAWREFSELSFFSFPQPIIVNASLDGINLGFDLEEPEGAPQKVIVVHLHSGT